MNNELKTYKHWVILMIIIWSAPLKSHAQQQLFSQFKFHRLNETNGLIADRVNDIIQDTLGFIWVGTNEGLYRYSDQSFEAFIKHKASTNYINNNYIVGLEVDEQNNVWFSTDDGISYYSYEQDKVQQFLPGLIHGRTTLLAFDDQKALYFGTFEGGVFRVKDSVITRLNLYDEQTGTNLNDYNALHIQISHDKLWATMSDQGVICYDLASEKTRYLSTQQISGVSKMKYLQLLLDSNNEVWVSSEKGVFKISISDDQFEVDVSLNQLLPPDDYLAMARDDQNVFWLGTRYSGLYAVDFDKSVPNKIRHYPSRMDQYGVSSPAVSRIFQDDQGTMWLGTHSGGVNVFNRNGSTVRTFTKLPDESVMSLPNASVWGLGVSASGNIWVGTDGAGLSKINPSTGQLTNQVFPALRNKAILTVHEDRNGRLWVGTFDSGLFLILPDGKIIQFHSSSPNSDLTVNDIRCIYETEDGAIYVGSNQGGLYHYRETDGHLTFIESTWALDIRSIAAYDDIMWLGTYGKGVIKLYLRNHEIVQSSWTTNELHKNDIVFDIATKGQTMYVATSHNGVVTYDMEADLFVTTPSLDKLSSRTISALTFDDADHLWVTTNIGVWAYHPPSDELKSFNYQDGLLSGHINFGSIQYMQNQFMAIGCTSGLNLFYPQELLDTESINTIIFSELRVFDKVVNPENSEHYPSGQSIFLTDKIQLDYSDNIFSIKLANPGFSKASTDEFMYYLEGYDDHWQNTKEANIAIYRNVPPGTYTFTAKNMANEAQRSLSVVITPPIWRTWYAFLLYFILIFFICWRLYLFNKSRILLQQKLRFEQRQRETEHQLMQEKLRFYTNFSHELKTPLTLIQGPVADLLRTTKDKRDLKYLNLIKKNTSTLLRFINRMLEFRKIELNKIVLNVGFHDLNHLVTEEAESFSFLARKRGIKFRYSVENKLEAWFDIEKMQIILNNLLSNALKFTPENKYINFVVHKEGANILIEVSDEGLGIQKSEIQAIFSPFYQASNSYGTGGSGIGLALSKSFVELHHGTIAVESTEGAGTKFTITMPTDKERFEGNSSVRFTTDSNIEKSPAIPEQSDGQVARQLDKEAEKVLLIVDDNTDILEYVESLFAPEYEVLKAENGHEAYELTLKNTPDIIISDIMMPGIDGFEFCQKIKGNMSTSHIPVIMLTAKDSKHDKVKGFELGIDGYVTKPFESEVLVARVNSLMKNRDLLELRFESKELVDPKASGSSREAEFILMVERTILELLEGSEFSVTLLCKEIGMSQSAVYRKVKTLTGLSIQEFVRNIKLKKAAHLLLSEDMTISEIAFSLDFSDLKYFGKCFKNQFGMSASAYRNQYSAV